MGSGRVPDPIISGICNLSGIGKQGIYLRYMGGEVRLLPEAQQADRAAVKKVTRGVNSPSHLLPTFLPFLQTTCPAC
jgi:hypothetical protein